MPEFKSTINVQDNYTLPTADGSEKQILETDGAGNVDWQDNPSYKLVRNDSGSTIGAGNIVRIDNSFGAISTIVVADNSTCSCADGITIESIANGDNGLIQLKGVIQESFINTDALTAGNVVYLGTSGGYTDVKPSSGFVVKIAKVGVEAPSGGSLLLSMPNYATDFEDLSGELELDQINATGTADNTTYLRGDGTWSSVSASPAGSNGQIQFNDGGSFGADTDLFWDATDNELGIGTATPDAHITIEQPGTGGKEFLKINATAAAGRPITLYDNGTFVGGIDYNFSGNYFSFDVTNAGGTRVTDAFVLMSESNDNFLGLGTASPAYRLDVNGDINISSGSSYRVNGSPLDFSDIAGDVNLSTQVAGILPVANGGTGVASSASYTNPTGSMIMYGGSTAPSGWLLCDGSAVSRTGYSALFSVIGTSYGVGNGFSTFNLPDMRGRFPAGRNVSDLDFNTLGETGGTASHSHTATGMGAAIGRGGSTLYLNTSGSNSWNATHINNITTNWTTSTQSFSDSVDILGSTDLAETYPPYQVFNFIIKT